MQDLVMNIKTVVGDFAEARVFTVHEPEMQADPGALGQIRALCSCPALAGSRIRIMPDVHAGKLCPIGFTATFGEQILPMLVGIDAGCGVTMVRIDRGLQDWKRLDRVIREQVPVGGAIRSRPSSFAGDFSLESLRCCRHIRTERALLSLGTLGGGNHFIEVDAGEEQIWLAVHSGSRDLGRAVTEHYLTRGQRLLKERGEDVPYEWTWLEGDAREDYLEDLALVQEFASRNRRIMIQEILKGMKWKAGDEIECCHNYADFRPEIREALGAPLLRKGAISACAGEKVIVPVSMGDGIILGEGLGNVDWNLSAPHGSGRIIPRSQVKEHCNVAMFRKRMAGIHCSCIGPGTLDESPAAYRDLASIRDALGETVKITAVLRPLYSFKGGSAGVDR